MARTILIHGSWMGGWCWDAIVNLLGKASCPTLAGLGEDPEAGLAAHVAQIVDDARSDDDLILVGHSYGAVVACEAAAILGGRVERVIILDGFLLRAGESIFYRYPDVEALLKPLVMGTPAGFIPPPPRELLEGPGERLPALFMERLKGMPIATHKEPVRASATDLDCPVHYVRFARFPGFAETEKEARKIGWKVSAVTAGHMAIITDPQAVCDKILEDI